tara:strand:+ start:4245 stop:5102 length:858 start_codon:yes stop_codon:yes gene_type:complete
MKVLWLVSFRPIGKSKSNDLYQSMFVDSIKSLNKDIYFSLTQFDEANVKKFVREKKIKNFYKNIPKKKLPPGKKYSNKYMLSNALDQFIHKERFDYLIFSTADIVVPSNLFHVLKKINLKNFCGFVFPNTQVINGELKNTFWPYFGIDLIVFKIDKKKAREFKKIIKFYNQYDWGVIENFYIAVCEILKLKKINLYKKMKVIKYENDFKSFSENRSWQINSWKENQKYFIEFLDKYKLSKLYAYGSYYYLLYKVFNFKDLNFNLFLSYLIFYPYNLFKKFISYFK